MRRLNLFFVISAILAVPLNVGYAALPTEGFIASFGTPVDIASVNDIVYAMKSVDLDNNGDLDIVIGCGPAEDYTLILLENDGTGTFTAFDAGDVSGGISSLTIYDLGSDGDMDIIAGSLDGIITAFENDGTPFDGVWSSYMCLNTGSSSPTFTSAISFRYAFQTHPGACGYKGNTEYKDGAECDGAFGYVSGPSAGIISPTGAPFSDSWHLNPVTTLSMANFVSIAGQDDWEQDGNFYAGTDDGKLYYFESTGNPVADTWNMTTVVSEPGASIFTTGDTEGISGDRDLDGIGDLCDAIVTPSGYTIAVEFRNKTAKDTFTHKVIDTGTGTPTASINMYYGSRVGGRVYGYSISSIGFSDGLIRNYESPALLGGDPRNDTWTAVDIVDLGDQIYQLNNGDFDLDGDNDLIAAYQTSTGASVALIENEHIHSRIYASENVSPYPSWDGSTMVADP